MQRITPEQVGLCSQRLARIGSWMRDWVDSGRLPGMVVLVARRGQVAFFDAYGMRDVAAGLPMGVDTVFRIYSMTKPLTSVAIMMLYEEGRFQLDDPIARHLPMFAAMRVFSSGNVEHCKHDARGAGDRQELHAEQRRQAEAEEQHDEAGGQRVRVAGEYEVGMHEGERTAGCGTGGDTDPGVARLGRDRIAGQRTGEHAALDAEVHDPGPFGEGLADTGEQDRCPAADGPRHHLNGKAQESPAFLNWPHPKTPNSSNAIRITIERFCILSIR